ncbi:unnamed protein product [Bursaphelenchus okinawaensis]|uniref:Uncharacterized protein n=1 Tax=Bursaphelenchus okinawaensis TaxID=465554 RepID=A0A811KRY4_9BILA|nr:unnamed protein product [Bursaphelenchus okinawaensis]CAG9110326.1 unnamed protein product [Bursaphelenchus okinawaensis]
MTLSWNNDGCSLKMSPRWITLISLELVEVQTDRRRRWFNCRQIFSKFLLKLDDLFEEQHICDDLKVHVCSTSELQGFIRLESRINPCRKQMAKRWIILISFEDSEVKNLKP